MRHKWGKGTEKDFLKCISCGLEVKAYKIKLGGLPKCKPVKKQGYVKGETALINCPECKKLVPNAIVCVYCGHQLRPLGFNSHAGG